MSMKHLVYITVCPVLIYEISNPIVRSDQIQTHVWIFEPNSESSRYSSKFDASTLFYLLILYSSVVIEYVHT